MNVFNFNDIYYNCIDLSITIKAFAFEHVIRVTTEALANIDQHKLSTFLKNELHCKDDKNNEKKAGKIDEQQSNKNIVANRYIIVLLVKCIHL